jgi:hypothetical protein
VPHWWIEKVTKNPDSGLKFDSMFVSLRGDSFGAGVARTKVEIKMQKRPEGRDPFAMFKIFSMIDAHLQDFE